MRAPHLTAEQIGAQLVGKTFLGFFPPMFKYVVSIQADGRLEGKNNYQHYDVGRWTIDPNTHTFSVAWELGWVSSTSHVYAHDDVFELVDAQTGKLNTRFDKAIAPVASIEHFEI
jgi:hypothetical protein